MRQPILGTSETDILLGTDDNDVIWGKGDRDLLLGKAGNDILNGGAGDDLMFGGSGDDTLNGGDGEDRLFGNSGDDQLVGNKGDDTIVGGAGKDLLIWNNGDGSDLMLGGSNIDRVQVNFNTDLVNDDLQNDDVARIEVTPDGVKFARIEVNGQTELGLFELDIRQTENLEVNGGGGNDTVELVEDIAAAIGLELDGGADTADDAPATDASALATGDTIDLSEFGSGVLVDLDENNQGVLQPPGADGISDSTRPGLSEFGNVQVDGEIAIAELNDFENVIGTDFDDTIFGNTQNNVLIGGAGNDALHPFGGADFVDGGAGRDLLLLNGFADGQLVDLVKGTGQNLDGEGSINTFINIEDVNGSSVAGDKIYGDNGGNRLSGLGGVDLLRGRGGNDILSGGDDRDFLLGDNGNDVLLGGSGNDVLQGGDDADIFVLGQDNGTDTIVDFELGVDRIGLTGGIAVGDLTFSGNRLQLGGDTLAVLQGVNTSALEASDFITNFTV
ncbi:MAG: calcium-binding protein [Cyanobacteria bacterium P01_A01_bin.3]